MAEHGYRFCSSTLCAPTLKGLEHQEFIFERCGHIPGLANLEARLAVAESKLALDSAQSDAKVATLENDLRSAEQHAVAEAARCTETISTMRRDFENIERNLHAEVDDLKAQLEAFRCEECAVKKQLDELRREQLRLQELQASSKVLAAENDVLKERLALAEVLAPLIQQIDVPAQETRQGEKLIRIACAGVSDEQVDIAPLPNGVSVQIFQQPTEDGDDAAAIFTKDFTYDHCEGFYQLQQEACGIQNGVLELNLKLIPRRKLRLGRSRRIPLEAIDEQQTVLGHVAVLADMPQPSSLSPSGSLGSLNTISSFELAGAVDDAIPGLMQNIVDSWLLPGGPNCFMPDQLFRTSMGLGAAPVFQPAYALQQGFRVFAADNVTLLEVVSIKVHQTREVLLLEAGSAMLTVTENHRMMTPAVGCAASSQQEVKAYQLAAGDAVMCKTKEGKIVARQLTDVFVMNIEESNSASEVFEVTFKPDKPVAVFQVPSTLLSKGFKKKPVRRGHRKSGKAPDGIQMPDTEGEYSD